MDPPRDDSPGRVRLLSRFYFTGDATLGADLLKRAFPALEEIGELLASPTMRLPWRMESIVSLRPHSAHWAAVAAYNLLAVPRRWCRHDRGCYDLFHDLRDAEGVPFADLAAGAKFIHPQGRYTKLDDALAEPEGGNPEPAHPPMLVVPADAVPLPAPDPPPCGNVWQWDAPTTWCDLPGDALATIADAVDAALADPPRLNEELGAVRYVPARPWEVLVDPANPDPAPDWTDQVRKLRDRFAALRDDGPDRVLAWRVPLRSPERWWPDQSAPPPEAGDGPVELERFPEAHGAAARSASRTLQASGTLRPHVLPRTGLMFRDGAVRSADSPRPPCASVFGFNLDRDAGPGTGGVGEGLEAFLGVASDAGRVLPVVSAEATTRLWSRWGEPVACPDLIGFWLEALFAVAWGSHDPRLPAATFRTVYPGQYQTQRGHGYVTPPLTMRPAGRWRTGPGLVGRTGGEFLLDLADDDPGPYAFPAGPNGEPALRRFGSMASPAAASVGLCDWLLAEEEAKVTPAGDLRRPVLLSYGRMIYGVEGCDPVVVSDTEDAILQCFIERPAIELADLQKESGVSNPSRILEGLREKFPTFKPAIELPGGKSRGGYRATVRYRDEG